LSFVLRDDDLPSTAHAIVDGALASRGSLFERFEGRCEEAFCVVERSSLV
jgi:hypothetical protein